MINLIRESNRTHHMLQQTVIILPQGGRSRLLIDQPSTTCSDRKGTARHLHARAQVTFQEGRRSALPRLRHAWLPTVRRVH
jgi:hypothetical protein